ncbi:hypothetical protein FRB95_003385 [Tulasnella sp. JGI-2019a]|nr:hypothetical protein FRB95_003385 [Tulasnella sp. JGI-2019a]
MVSGPGLNGATEKPPPPLPNEVLCLIFNHCAKPDLFACCLANKAMYGASIGYIYNDPFHEWPVYYGRDSDTQLKTYASLTMHEGRRKSYKLCRTLLENPAISQLVRKYHIRIWNHHVLGNMAQRVIPCLVNLTEPDPTFQDNSFISTCTLQLQGVSVLGRNDSLRAAAFWRWLERQRDLRRLRVVPELLPDLSPFALPRLDWLCASPPAARVVLPNAVIRTFTEKPNTTFEWLMGRRVGTCWSEEDITEVVPLMGRSLCHIEAISISAANVNVLFQVFR